ncbi:plasmid mobilization protein [Streptomyces roseifaciens]|uniref:plasmid mobilization protein n=1 Tax=Streptomyces roseifaciens TaxID=1488406 RepID=UPI000A980F3F|nr:plasmid mobilization relaxosome protein MobC [Streptomyces roseifaciens]
MSQQPRVRHRTRQPRQRNRFRNVRLSDSELALISAGAKAAGMTDAGFLAHAGLAAARDLTTTAARIAGDRELLAELFAARRHLGQVGNNLNQIAKILNSDGHAPQTDVVLSAVRRATDRLQAATVRLLDQ